MSDPSPPRRMALPLLIAAVVLVAGGVVGYLIWSRSTALPKPGEPRYDAYVSAFQVGTAQLDTGLLKEAEENLTKAIDLVSQEPAGWANRAVLFLRVGQRFKDAAADLERARALAPGNAELEELAGFLAEEENRLPAALEHFRKASDADPGNVRRLYKIAEIIAKEAGPDADKQRAEVLAKVFEKQPANLPVLSEYARVGVRLRDKKAVDRAIEQMDKLSGSWKPNTREKLAQVKTDIKGAQWADLEGHSRELGNLMMQEAGYAESAEKLSPRGAQVGVTFQTFVKLAPPRTAPDEADTNLTFKEAGLRPLPDVKAKKWDGVVPVWLNDKERYAVFVCDGREVRRADAAGAALKFPGGAKDVPPGMDGVLGVDWNNDRNTDLLLAGAGGLRFYQQKDGAAFDDVTAKTKLPADVLGDDYFGAWAVDIDSDGDLDILLARRKGPPLLLRNNFDGTFTAQPIFPGVEAMRGFAWLDLDHDGVADAALLDAQGKLHVFMNRRSGKFERREGPPVNEKYQALAVADVNDDGVLDLIALRDDNLIRISDRNKGKEWDTAELGKVPPRKGPPVLGDARLVAADLDNNGAVDLILRTPDEGFAWLANGKGGFQSLATPLPQGVAEVVDLDENGSLDLLGLNEKGQITRHEAAGTRGYQWFAVKPRSILAQGDNRINSFGLGGDVEMRAGVLVVKQPTARPVVHFGLGSRKQVDLLRITWSNGSSQTEFEKPSGAAIEALQRLKGSCPFLYTWDGERMVFVKDFCWSTPLGMYINAQNKDGFMQTTEWLTIRGDQLVPRDGVYDVRVNANLWETHYLDELGLMVVDHPPGTELHIDERFFLEPTPPRLYLTGPSRPVARAWDHKGDDVTDIVRSVDGKYLDRCGRGTYQGITIDHWVEVDLGDDAPTKGPVYLLAHGWIHPTDSSINFAIEQAGVVRPKPLTLEVPDGKGGWKVGRPALGFPAGKNKTCVIRLDGIDGEGVSRRFRLRTNLEIFWDALHYATGLDAGQCKQQRLSAKTADLRFRGIVSMTQASPSAPELPHYDEVYTRSQRWRDLTGMHTRFGDIRELIEKTDDRYVIMNAGDEIRLTYTAPPPPPAGWKRDFVWVTDGWVKDGDPNTRWGKTVLPLPYHGMKGYDASPGQLEDDPVYRRFPKDWATYHTRFVTPALFERGLRTFVRPRTEEARP